MCTMTSPKERISGLRRKPYLSSGKSLAISRMRLFREMKCPRTDSEVERGDWARAGRNTTANDVKRNARALETRMAHLQSNRRGGWPTVSRKARLKRCEEGSNLKGKS